LAAIEAAKGDLAKIKAQTDKSEDMQKMETQREEYFKIRSEF